MTPKDPIFITSGRTIVRVDYGHAKAYVHPRLEIIDPSYASEFGAFTPAQNVSVWNVYELEKLAAALTTVVAEYKDALAEYKDALAAEKDKRSKE